MVLLMNRQNRGGDFGHEKRAQPSDAANALWSIASPFPSVTKTIVFEKVGD